MRNYGWLLISAALAPVGVAQAYEKEMAIAERCFQKKAAQYAAGSCFPPPDLARAVRGACQKEYRDTLRAFTESPAASMLTDRDKLDLALKLFDGADDRIQYYVTEERLILKRCGSVTDP